MIEPRFISYDDQHRCQELLEHGLIAKEVAMLLGYTHPVVDARHYLNQRQSPFVASLHGNNPNWLTVQAIILQIYQQQTGRVIMAVPGLFQNPQYPFMVAQLDAYTDCGRLLAIYAPKTLQDWNSKKDGSVLPEQIIVEQQHNLLVTSCSIADVAVLIALNDLKFYKVQANPIFQTWLARKEEMICSYMQHRTELPSFLENRVPCHCVVEEIYSTNPIHLLKSV